MKRFLPLGIVVDGLASLPRIVDALLEHPYVASSDTAISAPLYKATPEIAEVHATTKSSRERLRLYLERGVLDEAVRAQVAQLFAADYRARYGRGERRDVFLASAGILRIGVTLKTLRQLEPAIREAVAHIIRNEPHDMAALARELEVSVDLLADERRGPLSDASIYELELKLFLDNVYNPYRLKDPHVLEVVQGAGYADPAVIEFWTSPAIPGYAWAVVGELAQMAHGIPVWMEVSEALR